MKVAEFGQKMLTTRSLILKDKLQLKTQLKEVSNFIVRAGRLSFWHSHFAKQNFKLNPRKFGWNYWRSIPLINKEDFLSIGLDKRLSDVKEIIRRKVLGFILQSTSGTSRATGPVLFLKKIDSLVDGQLHQKGNRILILYQGRAISLRDVIAVTSRGQSLVVNPFMFSHKMIKAVKEFNSDTTVTFPSSLLYLTSSFAQVKRMFSSINYALLSGDFLSQKQRALVKKNFPQIEMDLDYIMTEVDSIGICCRFLKSVYGANAYHPYQQRIVELIDIDKDGYGEVVVTKMRPIELAFIRYKTGDVARAIKQRCKCGSQWTLFLAGRKNMDYIKSLGVLITRAEIERVFKEFYKQIEEWRGQVREVELNGVLVGELTLLVKLHNRLTDKNLLKKLKEKISTKLLLTPRKTLIMLAREKKFMPLKIRLVKQFPPTAKKVLLQKIVD